MDELRAQLYAPLRMEERLFYLEHVVLPCIRAQSDKSFRMVMLMGDQLPEPWRGRVLSLIADIPEIVPAFEPEGQRHSEVCRKVMRANRSRRAAAVAEFRLDDDDAMALDFVAQTRIAYRQHRRLLQTHGAFCVDFTKGFALITTPEGIRIRPVFQHLVGIAQALIYPPKHFKSILDYPHKRLWMSMPNVTMPSPAKWVRGVHQTNDSGIAAGVDKLPSWTCEPAEIPALFASEFAIDLDALDTAWTELNARRAA